MMNVTRAADPVFVEQAVAGAAGAAAGVNQAAGTPSFDEALRGALAGERGATSEKKAEGTSAGVDGVMAGADGRFLGDDAPDAALVASEGAATEPEQGSPEQEAEREVEADPSNPALIALAAPLPFVERLPSTPLGAAHAEQPASEQVQDTKATRAAEATAPLEAAASLVEPEQAASDDPRARVVADQLRRTMDQVVMQAADDRRIASREAAAPLAPAALMTTLVNAMGATLDGALRTGSRPAPELHEPSAAKRATGKAGPADVEVRGRARGPAAPRATSSGEGDGPAPRPNAERAPPPILAATSDERPAAGLVAKHEGMHMLASGGATLDRAAAAATVRAIAHDDAAHANDVSRSLRQAVAAEAVNHMTLSHGARATVEVPELGSVNVEAQRRGGEVDVAISADAEAIAVLHSAAPKLEEALRSRALEIGELSLRERDPQDPHAGGRHSGHAAANDDRREQTRRRPPQGTSSEPSREAIAPIATVAPGRVRIVL
jgi:hypothetical protein